MNRRLPAVAGLLLLMSTPSANAQDLPAPTAELRSAYAFLMGLTGGAETPRVDRDADVFASIPESADAPRYVVRMEVSGNGCRVRTISALQFPGKWAALTLKMVDLQKVRSATGYASVDDLIAGSNPISVHDPRAQQVVLHGEGLECSSRLSLDDSSISRPVCGNRLDISMMDEDQVRIGRAALALAARTCKIEALKK